MITVNFLQILSLFKKYWREILLIILSVIIIGKMRVDQNRMKAAHETTEEELKAQISELNRIHTEEMEQKKKNKQLSAKRKTTLAKQFTHNKDDLADEISNTFGIQYTP